MAEASHITWADLVFPSTLTNSLTTYGRMAVAPWGLIGSMKDGRHRDPIYDVVDGRIHEALGDQ